MERVYWALGVFGDFGKRVDAGDFLNALENVVVEILLVSAAEDLVVFKRGAGQAEAVIEVYDLIVF